MMDATKVSGTPEQLLGESIVPEEIRETGSLGSPVLALRGGHPDALKCMADIYERRFRKGWRDMKAGIAVFMAPAMRHEVGSKGTEDLVLALCKAQGIPVVSLSSTTLRGGQDGEGRRGDPDESFFIGDKAEAFLAMQQSHGVESALNAFEDTAADLAIEVEHTHYDEAKRAIYWEAGVVEMWEMGTPRSGKAPTIIDLQAPDGPQAAGASRLIPGVRADKLDAALDVLRELGGLVGFVESKALGRPVAQQLLDVAGRPASRRLP